METPESSVCRKTHVDVRQQITRLGKRLGLGKVKGQFPRLGQQLAVFSHAFEVKFEGFTTSRNRFFNHGAGRHASRHFGGIGSVIVGGFLDNNQVAFCEELPEPI